MNDGNGTKTKDQLLDEIEALKGELERRGADAGKPAPVGTSAPVFSVPITRRESLVSWVAPVILSLPVVQGVRMILKPGAGATDDATAPSEATAKPRPIAAALPKTRAPSAAPTALATPTMAGKCVVAPTAAPPTAAPTASPTLGMGAAPNARPAVRFMALGGARAVISSALGT